MFKMNMKKTIASILAATMAVSMLSTTVSAMTYTYKDPYGVEHTVHYTYDERAEVFARIKEENERMRKEIEESKKNSISTYTEVTADMKLDKISKMKYFGKDITFKDVKSDAKVISSIAYAAAQGANTCTLKLDSNYKKNGWKKWLTRAVDISANKTYNVCGWSMSRYSGTFEFKDNTYATFIYAYRYDKTDLIKKMSKEDQQFYNKCVKILKECGVNDKNKTDAEKALAIRNWLDANVEREVGTPDIAKYAIVEQKCDCGGFADAYMLLMRMSGYKCWSVADSVHIWNAVRIDGELRYIDVGNGKSYSKTKLFFTYDEYKKVSGHKPDMTNKELEMYCKY